MRHDRRHDRQGPPPRPGGKRGTRSQAVGKPKGGWTTIIGRADDPSAPQRGPEGPRGILALTDALGNLMRFVLLPGQRYDTMGAAPLIQGIEFDALIADEAFDANRIMREMNERGAGIVISQRPKRLMPLAVDLEAYRERKRVEVVFAPMTNADSLAVGARREDVASGSRPRRRWPARDRSTVPPAGALGRSRRRPDRPGAAGSSSRPRPPRRRARLAGPPVPPAGWSACARPAASAPGPAAGAGTPPASGMTASR